MNLEHANAEMFTALAKAQAEIENASKNANNPHFKSKYADLAEVLTTIRETFSKHGLGFLQATGFDGSLVNVTTTVTHSSGGYITSVASCVPAKTDAQGIGSATTYLRRYGGAAMAGIAQEDDDGQAAAHSGKPAPVQIGRPTDGAWEAMDVDQQIGLLKIAATIKDYFSANNELGGFEYYVSQKLDSDEKAALWTQLESRIRTSLTKEHNKRQAAEKAA